MISLTRNGWLVAWLAVTGLTVTGLSVGCQRRSRDESEQITKRLNEKSLESDSLRQGLRYLAQSNPTNRASMSSEVRVLLNAWLKTADVDKASTSNSKLLEGLDARSLESVGCESINKTQFSAEDMDYLFQCHIMRQLSDWIVKGPVHDRILQPVLDDRLRSLEASEATKLERAFKLFDWTIRNVKLAPSGSSQVGTKTRDQRLPLQESCVGYANLPWEATLFSDADFVVRGRVFSALATQQGIDTCWISVGAGIGIPGDLWAMGVLINNQLLLLEPKLGLPILDPDTNAWATLHDVVNNPRILRRLSLPQYPYAFDSDAIRSVQLLIDAVPFSASRRARLLESAMLGEQRMVVAVDLDQLVERLGKAAPNAVASLWHTPLLAQLYSVEMRERLSKTTEYALRYWAENAIWLLENPVATGRVLHLAGKFENTMDQVGALKTYIDTRVDDESLRKLAYNPDVQKAMGLYRSDQESKEQFDARVRQVQFLFSRSKFDVAFLLAQLHYDRGDYASTVYWLNERVLSDTRAVRWHAAGWYTLARAYIQLEKYSEAEEALTRPSIDEGGSTPGYLINPQDAGNRLRLRLLRKMIETDSAGDTSGSTNQQVE